MTAWRRLVLGLCLLIGSTFLNNGTVNAIPDFSTLRPLNIALLPSDPETPFVVSGHVFSQVEPTSIRGARFELTDWNGADLWTTDVPWTEDFSDGTSARVPFEFDFSEYRLAGKYRLKAYLLGDRDTPLAVGRRIVNFPWSTEVEGSVSEISDLTIIDGDQVQVKFSFLNRGKAGNFQGEVRVFEDSPNRPQVLFERTDSVNVGLNNEYDFTLSFDHPHVPQLYVVEVAVAESLGDAVTGVLRQAFLVDGKFAEAQDVVIAPQRYYQEGDLVSIEFGGYARNVPGAVHAVIVIQDERTTEIFKSEQDLPLLDEYGHIRGKVTFPLEMETAQLQGTVSLSHEGEALGETSFKTPRFPNQGLGKKTGVSFQIAKTADQLGSVWKTNPKIMIVGAAGILGVFLLVVIFAVAARRKRIRGKHLLLLVAAGFIFGQVFATDTKQKYLPETSPELILYELAPPYEEHYSVNTDRRVSEFNQMEFNIVGYSMGFDASMFSGVTPTVLVSFDDGSTWITPDDIYPLDDLYIPNDWLTFFVTLPSDTPEGWITPRIKITSGLAPWVTMSMPVEFEWRDVLVDNTPPTVTVSRNPAGWTNGAVTVSVDCDDFGGAGCVAAEGVPVQVIINENHGEVKYWMCDKVSNCGFGTVDLTGTDTVPPVVDNFDIYDYEEATEARQNFTSDSGVTRALLTYLLKMEVHDEGDTLSTTEDPCADITGEFYWDDVTMTCQPQHPWCIKGDDGFGGVDLTRGSLDLPGSAFCEPNDTSYDCTYTDFPFCFNLTLPGSACIDDSECVSNCTGGVEQVGTCVGGACTYSTTPCGVDGCSGGTCCVADCSGKVCGDDNGCGNPCNLPCADTCYNTAGIWNEYFNGVCTSGGCVYDDNVCGSGCTGDSCCVPDCAGKTCGDDGCGGTCAPGCTPLQHCDANGICKNDCLATTVAGNCELLNANDGAYVAGTCAAGFVGTCAYTCDNGAWNAPLDNQCVVPVCTLDTDCEDGNDCTLDQCLMSGTPSASCSHVPEAIDTSCTTNGGSVCNVSGTCVVCNTSAQCDDSDPGTDNVCENPGLPSSYCDFPPACTDTCVSLGYECGMPDVCGTPTDCGATCPDLDCSSMDTECRTYDPIPQDTCNATTFVCEHPTYPAGCGSLVTDVAIGTSAPIAGGFCDGMGAVAVCGTDANCDDFNASTTDTCLKPNPSDSLTWSCSNVLACTDECTLAETRCNAGNVENCATDHDGDVCTEWGVQTTCTGGDVCADNAGTDECCDANFGNTVNTDAVCGGTVLCDGSVTGATDCTAIGQICDSGTCVTSCSPTDCAYIWQDSSICSVTCGGGNYQREAKITVAASCGGTCAVTDGELETGYNGSACNTQTCCAANYGNPCTGATTCMSGTVACDGATCDTSGGTFQCGGSTPVCSGADGVCVECAAAGDCVDGLACTTDSCNAGVCENTPTNMTVSYGCDTTNPWFSVDASTMLYHGDLYNYDSCGNISGINQSCTTGCVESTDPAKDKICVDISWQPSTYCPDATTALSYCCTVYTEPSGPGGCGTTDTLCNNLGLTPPSPGTCSTGCTGTETWTGGLTDWICDDEFVPVAMSDGLMANSLLAAQPTSTSRVRYQTCTTPGCCSGSAPIGVSENCSTGEVCYQGTCVGSPCETGGSTCIQGGTPCCSGTCQGGYCPAN